MLKIPPGDFFDVALTLLPKKRRNGDITISLDRSISASFLKSSRKIRQIMTLNLSKGEAKNIILRTPKVEIPLIMGYKRSGMRHIETITGAMIKDIIPDA